MVLSVSLTAIPWDRSSRSEPVAAKGGPRAWAGSPASPLVYWVMLNVRVDVEVVVEWIDGEGFGSRGQGCGRKRRGGRGAWGLELVGLVLDQKFVTRKFLQSNVCGSGGVDSELERLLRGKVEGTDEGILGGIGAGGSKLDDFTQNVIGDDDSPGRVDGDGDGIFKCEGKFAQVAAGGAEDVDGGVGEGGVGDVDLASGGARGIVNGDASCGGGAAAAKMEAMCGGPLFGATLAVEDVGVEGGEIDRVAVGVELEDILVATCRGRRGRRSCRRRGPGGLWRRWRSCRCRCG